MYDFLRVIGEPQYHVMVLASVKLGTKQFVTIQQLSGKNAEMADIIVGSQVVRCIIRLEMHGQHMIDIASLKSRFITVDVIRPLLIDCLCILKKHGGMQNIIMVK